MSRVVLVSGGMDSAVALELAKRGDGRRPLVAALAIDYGQRNRTELECAKEVAKRADVPLYSVSTAPLWSGLASPTVAFEHGRTVQEITAVGPFPRTYTPGRNTVLLSIAMAFATSHGLNEIWIGANADDRNGYPDCRREYLDAFESLVLTTGYPLRVMSPLSNLTKRQVVALGHQLGVDFTLTSSCYFGTDCGKCDACVLRADALAERSA